VAAAILLTSTKVVVGWATGSLGIMAEAAHSALDLVAAAMTLWAVWMASKPADPDHPYGHGKFENLSALFETLLLLVTCVWIVYESIQRLFFEEVHVDANIWAFLVVITSIVVDVSRSRALMRAAKKHQSQALEADALHFSTDVWSSAVVLVGLFAVLIGERLSIPWLAKADAVAALGVALIVVGVSLKLGKKSIDDLLDRAPDDLSDRVKTAAEEVQDVREVTQVRLRRSGPEVFADVTLKIDRSLPFEKTHSVADRVEEAVQAVVPKADVVVHVEPASGGEDLPTMARLIAARHGAGAHAIRLLEHDGEATLEVHLEVDQSLSLDEAHRRASAFEEELHRAAPRLSNVVTHLEPSDRATATSPAEAAVREEVVAAIHEFLDRSDRWIGPHNIQVHWADGELAVSFHCTLEAGTAITVAHEMTVQLEKHLRARVPRVGRMMIHVEPERKPGEAEGTQTA
jgi:cation diffusion facilitator family transporter